MNTNYYHQPSEGNTMTNIEIYNNIGLTVTLLIGLFLLYKLMKNDF